jgi:hypothetical protein
MRFIDALTDGASTTATATSYFNAGHSLWPARFSSNAAARGMARVARK